MITKRFICKQCGYKFEAKIFELGEAEEKGVPIKPIRCPKCNGPVERTG